MIQIQLEFRWHHPGREEESIQRSLENLGLDYVDLVCLMMYLAADNAHLCL